MKDSLHPVFILQLLVQSDRQIAMALLSKVLERQTFPLRKLQYFSKISVIVILNSSYNLIGHELDHNKHKVLKTAII